MNPRAKRILKFLSIGGIGGLVAFLIVIFSGLIVSKGSSLYAFFTRIFVTVNKPLEFIPQLQFLADRQDPILSFVFLAAYWATLGILVGAFAFLFAAWRQRVNKGRSNLPN